MKRDTTFSRGMWKYVRLVFGAIINMISFFVWTSQLNFYKITYFNQKYLCKSRAYSYHSSSCENKVGIFSGLKILSIYFNIFKATLHYAHCSYHKASWVHIPYS